LPEFGVGFLEGFFVDGAAGNVTGLWYAAETAVKLWWLWETKYSPSRLVGRALAEDDFAIEYIAKASDSRAEMKDRKYASIAPVASPDDRLALYSGLLLLLPERVRSCRSVKCVFRRNQTNGWD
jgi:hypothetical protein